MLFTDSREKADTKVLVAETITPTHIMALGCADFLIYDLDGHSLGIERKMASDLLGSLEKKLVNGNIRLWDQLARMEEAYTHRMLILEGGLGFDRASGKIITGKRLTGWNHGSIQAILMRIQFSGVILHPTADKYATVDWLRILHNRSLRGCVLPSGLKQLEEAEAA